MSRTIPYLGIVAALVLGAFVTSYIEALPHEELVILPPTDDVELIALPPIALPPEPEDIPTAAVEEDAPAPVVVEERASTPPVVASAPVTIEVQAAPVGDLDSAAATLRAALVNIICYVPAGSRLHSSSGSGIVVDPKGIILTNAHIGQYFLLRDEGVSCAIRAGDPATNAYKAEPIFISRAWLTDNPSTLIESAPNGSGEHDFALLAITGSATQKPLPESFAFVPLAIRPPEQGEPVVIASYGAQFLKSSQIQSSLSPTVVFGSVKEIFTFVANTADVLALGGSAAAQQGSSGGGVANAQGELVGTITTSTLEGETSARSLDAISAPYIRADYASDTGEAIDLLLSRAPSESIANFKDSILVLKALLAL